MSVRRKFTDYEKKTVYAKYNGCCALCGKPVKFKKLTISHKVPLSKGGGNEFKNLQLACWNCNHMKNCMTIQELYTKMVRILVHNRKEVIQIGFKNLFKKA